MTPLKMCCSVTTVMAVNMSLYRQHVTRADTCSIPGPPRHGGLNDFGTVQFVLLIT